MEVVTDTYRTLRSMTARQYLLHGVSLGLIMTSALIIWKTLMLVSGSESPVVVVLSGSMEPGFKKGDILFLHMPSTPVANGEIVVFNVDGRDIPIVHRVIRSHHNTKSYKGKPGYQEMLTKGDNNHGDDRVLYAPGQLWLDRDHVMGRSCGFLPHVGMVTIIMNDYVYLKYALIGFLGLLVLTSKE
ncbi:signal peptidase I [Pycnococcus provasolii]